MLLYKYVNVSLHILELDIDVIEACVLNACFEPLIQTILILMKII